MKSTFVENGHGAALGLPTTATEASEPDVFVHHDFLQHLQAVNRDVRVCVALDVQLRDAARPPVAVAQAVVSSTDHPEGETVG